MSAAMLAASSLDLVFVALFAAILFRPSPTGSRFFARIGSTPYPAEGQWPKPNLG